MKCNSMFLSAILMAILCLSGVVLAADLSGEYWFGSLSANVSTHVPWGKQGNVVVTGNNWFQEWDDHNGHHTFSSTFTTTVRSDGSININFPSKTYNIAWNGDVMIHADTAPDTGNRMGIDIMMRKANDIQVSNIPGNYAFFGHWLNWAQRADSAAWGSCIFKANGTAVFNVVEDDGDTDSGTLNWTLDAANIAINFPDMPPFSVCENGIIAMSWPDAVGSDPDFGYDLFIPKTDQPITRAEIADTYQVRFLESGPGGTPFTCGSGTALLQANGAMHVDAYYSDGEHDIFDTTYKTGPGNTFSMSGNKAKGIISSDKGLIFIPDYICSKNRSSDEWIGGIFLVRAPRQKYNLTAAVVGGHGTVLPAVGSYYSGTTVTLTATPDASYRVKTWTGANNVPAVGSNNNSVTLTADKTVAVEFEFIPPVISIQKCTVTAGKNNQDSISFSGTSNASEADLLLAMGDVVEVFFESDLMAGIPFHFPITTTTLKKGKFSSKIANASFALDTKTGKMTFSAKNAKLTGLACPISVIVSIGDYQATLELTETIVNGDKKLCPFQLMQGVKNTLDITKKPSFKKGKTAETDSLTVSGTFTVAADYKKAPLAITVGSQTFIVPGDKMEDNNNVASCKAKETGGITAKLDYEKCTFSISIKNANITQSGTVPFGIDCFDVSLKGFETIELN